jgi:hypothetical protein
MPPRGCRNGLGMRIFSDVASRQRSGEGGNILALLFSATYLYSIFLF